MAILLVLECGGQQYTLLTKQPRVPIGDVAFPEIPAGMLDGDGNFSGAAAKELREETGLAIPSSELVDLTGLAYGDAYKGMYPSCGGCDEFLRLFLHRKEMTEEELTALQGKLTGLREEGELITLQVLPLDDLWQATPDAKALSALLLYSKLLAAGKI